MSTSTVLMIFVAAVIAVGMLGWSKNARAQLDPDAQVIEQLRAAGSDLSKPHPIEFFLYLPSAEAGERVAAKLRALQFEVNVSQPDAGKDWLVFATKLMLPAHSELVRLRKIFGEIVAPERGEYDGWGTPIVD